MKPQTRACVAFILGWLKSGGGMPSVYDHDRVEYVRFTGRVDPDYVMVEHSDGWGVFGRVSVDKEGAQSLHLENQATMKPVELHISGDDFQGCDRDTHGRDTSGIFHGRISGGIIILYDYYDDRQHKYTVEDAAVGD